MERQLNLVLLKDTFALCRMEAGERVPAWVLEAPGFVTFSRTEYELSVVCREEIVPVGVRKESGWRMFMVQGPLEFSLTGVLLSMAKPLANAGLSIFAISTFDTDYVLVKEEKVPEAERALTEAGHCVVAE
jgi:hypothetical protein